MWRVARTIRRLDLNNVVLMQFVSRESNLSFDIASFSRLTFALNKVADAKFFEMRQQVFTVSLMICLISMSSRLLISR